MMYVYDGKLGSFLKMFMDLYLIYKYDYEIREKIGFGFLYIYLFKY